MVLVTIVMGWFAAGSIWNVRKGKAALRWMQGGLPLLGERTTVRWLGTTSVEMVIAKARKPFEQATLVIFLEPRHAPQNPRPPPGGGATWRAGGGGKPVRGSGGSAGSPASRRGPSRSRSSTS